MTDENPIIVVCATRLKKTEFLKKSLTGISISSLIETSPVKIRLFEDNKNGLSTCYNTAIQEFIDKDCILVFIHDDVLITDFFWTKRVIDSLNLFNIVGVAGNRRRVSGQSSWAFIDKIRTLDHKDNFSGAIAHGNSFPPNFLRPYGPSNMQCLLLDGVFLAAKTSDLKMHNLRFDEQFLFHFYDMDFCRNAEVCGLKMGTIPLSLIHNSGGSFNNDEWAKAYQNYIDKWQS